MDFLIDTHTFIWFINGDRSLSEKNINLIKNIENRCYISIASIWEIAIKLSIKKLKLKADFSTLSEILIENEIEILPITFVHIQKLLQLDFHHRDPFDRIILSQSLSENLPILTKDENFQLYQADIIW